MAKAFAFLLALQLATSQTLTESSPAFDEKSTQVGISGSSYITDGVSQVTQIKFFLGTMGSGGFYGAQITGSAGSLDKVPNDSSCYSTTNLTTFTVNLSSTQRVKTVIVHKKDGANPSEKILYKVEITLNDNTYLVHDASLTEPVNSVSYVFETPANSEFVGIFMADNQSINCRTSRFAVYYRDTASGVWDPPVKCQSDSVFCSKRRRLADICTMPTCINLDLSPINSQKQRVFSDTARTIQYHITQHNDCSSCPWPLYLDIAYSPSSATPNLFSFASSPDSVVFAESQNAADAKAYTITIKAKYSGQTAWSFSATATYTYVNPCLLATIITTPHPPTINTQLNKPFTSNTPMWYDSVSGSSAFQKCGPWTVDLFLEIKPAAFVLSRKNTVFNHNKNTSTHQLHVNPTDATQDIGTFMLSFDICLTNYPSRCTFFDTNVIITAGAACVVTTVQIVQQSDSGSLADQTYKLGNQFQYALTTKQTPDCAYNASNWAVEAVPGGGTGTYYSGFQQIGASTGIYEVTSTTAVDRIGTYQIKVTSVVVNGVTYTNTQLATPSSFILTVKTDCDNTVLSASEIGAITLKVWDPIAHYPASGSAFTDFTDTVSTAAGYSALCKKVYTATISPTTLTTFSFDDVNKQFQIFSDQLSQIGSYTVTVTGALIEFASVFVTRSFVLTVADPCATTSLIQPTALSNMKTSVLVQDTDGLPLYVTQQVGVFKDQVSVTNGDSSGTQYCGNRVYSLSSTPTSPAQALNTAELSIDSQTGLVQVYTARKETIGLHSVTVTVHLQTYQSITSSLSSFTVEIVGCILTSFTMPDLSPSFDKTYTISDQQQVWSLELVTVQVPPCAYPLTVSFQNTPDFVTATSEPEVSFSVFSRSLNNTGRYNIGVTASLSGYTYSPPLDAPTCSSQFTITAVDSCISTEVTIEPASIEDFVTFVGVEVQSLNKYVFNDTQTIQRTLVTDTQDFCGEKVLNFKLNGTENSIISAQNNDYIKISPPFDFTSFGVAQAQVAVKMASYDIYGFLDFKVTILGSVVPQIPAFTYKIGSEMLVVTYQSFQVLPFDYEVGPSNLKAYILDKGATLGQYVDFSCNCLKDISEKQFIKLLQEVNQLQIFSSDQTFVGDYTVVLVQSFDSLPSIHPYSKFQLNIWKQDEPKRKPPYFQPPLPSSIKVDQCVTSEAKPWSLQISPVIDPNNSTVNLTVQLDEKFFKFDAASSTITQKTVTNDTILKTIKLSAWNAFNLRTTVSIDVQFSCKLTVSTTSSSYTPSQQQKSSDYDVRRQRPVSVVSISRNGEVVLRFYKPVFVQGFPSTRNTSQSASGRRLATQAKQDNQTLNKLISKQILSIKLKTKQATSDLDWDCTSFENDEMKLQLKFPDPMEISQVGQDELIVQFIRPDLFMLDGQSEYLFSNDSQKILSFVIPPQLPSVSSVATFQSVTDTVKQAGITVIVATLLIQIVAKKIIGSMLVYFCALQLEILLVQKSNFVPPASVDLVINQIADIIKLSTLKQQIASFLHYLHIDVILNNSVVQSLDGIAVAGIGIILFVIVCGVTIWATKKFTKVQQFFLKIRDTIFWNFLIRYFQLAFIGFNFSALQNIQKSGQNYSDIITSSVILAACYGTICLIAKVLFKSKKLELKSQTVQKRIGNLYYKLSTRKRLRIMYGLMFFVQRAWIVLVLAFKLNFAIQWPLCYVAILANTAYLLIAKPYADPSDGLLDKVNCLFLYILVVVLATCSAWNTESRDKFIYGLAFDGIVVLQFFFNLVYVAIQVILELNLKLKRKCHQWKLAKTKKKALKKDLDDPSKTGTKPSSKNKGTTQRLSDQARIDMQRNKKELEQISEISYDSENQYEERMANTNNFNKKDRTQDAMLDEAQPRHTLESTVKKSLLPAQTMHSELLVNAKPTMRDFAAKNKVEIFESSQQPQPAEEQKPSFAQQMLEKEIQEYYLAENTEVRRYPPGRVFNVEDDMWPYYKQVTQLNYSGPYIELLEHNQQLEQYLASRWIALYPEMPYLPLFVSEKQYKRICSEIEPQVLRAVEERQRQKEAKERRR